MNLERGARATAERVLVLTSSQQALSLCAQVLLDPGDRIEYWGTRIGRALGLLAVAALMVWLALLLLDRG